MTKYKEQESPHKEGVGMDGWVTKIQNFHPGDLETQAQVSYIMLHHITYVTLVM